MLPDRVPDRSDERARNIATVVFIGVSLVVYLFIGTAPAALLVFVGGFNGLILPIGLTIFVWIGLARSRPDGRLPLPGWLLVLTFAGLRAHLVHGR